LRLRLRRVRGAADSARAVRLEPAVAQPEDAIETIQDHLVVGHAGDRRVLLDRDPAQQISMKRSRLCLMSR